MGVLGRAVSIVILLLLVTARGAAAQALQIRIDRIVVGAGRAIEVAATDSDVVIVTVDGGKYPLVSQSTAEAARRWVARADSIARAPSVVGRGADASERNEFGHNSDILHYQKFASPRGRRDVIAIDIGPNNLTMYEADVSSALLGQLTAAMRRAAHTADSLARSGRRTASVGATRNLQAPSGTDALTPSKRCVVASGLPPIDYSGTNGYALGTNLDKAVQPPLRPGSAIPSYPPSAAGARVTGNVVARFVIDTAGRPVIETFRLRSPTNALFVQSVCDALPLMRFAPSIVNGRAVPQLVDETFVIPPPTVRR